MSRSLRAAQTGWSIAPNLAECFATHGSASDHPVRSYSGGFAAFFLMSRPPLLTRRGLPEPVQMSKLQGALVERPYRGYSFAIGSFETETTQKSLLVSC